MRQLTLYIFFSFFAITTLISQDCDDKAIRYFDSQEELCGYHGGIKIPMRLPDNQTNNQLLRADAFAYKWSEAISNRRLVNYNIQRDRVYDYSNYKDIRYSVLDPQGIMQTVSLSIRIDNELNIRSYNASCAQLDMLISTNATSQKKISSDNTINNNLEDFPFVSNLNRSSVTNGNATQSDNSNFYTAPQGPEAICDFNNVEGFIGVSESPLVYGITANCNIEDNDYLGFQEDNNYLIGASVGNDESLLEVRCIENNISYTRIKDKSGMVQSLNETVEGYRHSDNHFVFCAQPGMDDSDIVGMYEYAMTYYHLTKTYDYLTKMVIADENNEFTPFPPNLSIRFDPYFTAVPGLYSVYQDINNDIIINFGAGDDPAVNRDLAEDDLYIVQAGFHAYWKYVLTDNDSPSDENKLNGEDTDGLLFGAIDYMTWRYSGETNLLTWGSNPSVYEREMTSPFNYSELLPNPTYQNRGQSFSNALFQISDVTSEEASDFLLYRIMPTMNVSTNQFNAAEMLYNEAKLEFEDDNDGSDNGNGITITFEDLCEIEEILLIKYGSALSLSGSSDYIIRDSYDGQPFNGEPQGEDIGLEPNTITSGFSKSPDIWNKIAKDPMNDKKHENPVYNNGADNYLYVELRTESCDPPDMDGLLHVYIRESHLSGVWPKDWTAGYYDDDPLMPLVGYEITHAPGNPLVSEGVPLSGFVYSYQDTESDKQWTVYRYEIPWVPINPASIPNNPAGANIWACLLARIIPENDPIDAEDDPIDTEEGSSAWTNNVNNNNIAIRNTSIHHVDGFTGGSNPSGDVLSSLNIISSIDDSTNGGGDPDDEEVEIEISVNPGPDLINDEDIFDYIDIELVLSDVFLDAWEPNGAEGDGFIRINTNTIRITDLNFNIRSIKLPPRKHHRVFVRTRNKLEFDQVGFSVLLKSKEQCIIGSQEYIVRGSEWENIGNRGDVSYSNKSDSSIGLSPNPVQDMLFVESKEYDIKELTIYNPKNEKIVLPIDNIDPRSAKINVSDLNSGVYIIQIKTENNIETRKFIKI